MNPKNFFEEKEKILLVQSHKIKKLDLGSNYRLEKLDQVIFSAEKILTKKQQDLPAREEMSFPKESFQSIHIEISYEQLLKDSEDYIAENKLETHFFSKEDISYIKNKIGLLDEEFNSIYRLDKWDWMIAGFAGTIGAAVDAFLIGVPAEAGRFGSLKIKGGTISNYVKDLVNNSFSPEYQKRLEKIYKVPYDASHSGNLSEYIEGLCPRTHRFQSLGHDPFLGFLFGTRDILKGTMTAFDKQGNLISQMIEEPESIGVGFLTALNRQFGHLASDIATKQGLPVPGMPLLQFFNIGSIGERERTIAELAKGMYSRGYDLRFFLAQSLSVLLIDVVVRLLYFYKLYYKEGNSLEDSIPVDLPGKYQPKLQTMLFAAHTIGVTGNLVKVHFTGPMGINAPQGLTFFRYGVSQLRWNLIEKEYLRQSYRQSRIDYDWKVICKDIESL